MQGVFLMNDKQQELINVVMEMISDTLESYKKDEYHAPAPWLLENWWNTLQCALNLSFSLSPYVEPESL